MFDNTHYYPHPHTHMHIYIIAVFNTAKWQSKEKSCYDAHHSSDWCIRIYIITEAQSNQQLLLLTANVYMCRWSMHDIKIAAILKFRPCTLLLSLPLDFILVSLLCSRHDTYNLTLIGFNILVQHIKDWTYYISVNLIQAQFCVNDLPEE